MPSLIAPKILPTQEKIGWMNQPMRAKTPKTPEDHNQGKVSCPVSSCNFDLWLYAYLAAMAPRIMKTAH